jgi:hypothetical protein
VISAADAPPPKQAPAFVADAPICAPAQNITSNLSLSLSATARPNARSHASAAQHTNRPRKKKPKTHPKTKQKQGLLRDFVPEQAAAFLVLLRAKGETPDEVAGLAKALLASAVPVSTRGAFVGKRGR